MATEMTSQYTRVSSSSHTPSVGPELQHAGLQVSSSTPNPVPLLPPPLPNPLLYAFSKTLPKDSFAVCQFPCEKGIPPTTLEVF